MFDPAVDGAPVVERLGGDGWIAERGEGWTTMSTPTGKWGNTDISFAITQAEFDTLRADPTQCVAIHERYNAVSGDGWWARRDDTCMVCLQDDRYGSKGRFYLPNDAFERLRDDPGLIGAICAEYMETGRFP